MKIEWDSFYLKIEKSIETIIDLIILILSAHKFANNIQVSYKKKGSQREPYKL